MYHQTIGIVGPDSSTYWNAYFYIIESYVSAESLQLQNVPINIAQSEKLLVINVNSDNFSLQQMIEDCLAYAKKSKHIFADLTTEFSTLTRAQEHFFKIYSVF